MHKPVLITLSILICLCLSFTKNINTPASDTTLGVTTAAVVKPTGSEKPAASARMKVESGIRGLYDTMQLSSIGLDFEVFRLGMIGYYNLKREGALGEKELLTIIDFALPSTEKRLFTINLQNRQLKYHTYVAHGKNTGENMATEFSNVPHSNQSSLGFYVTAETYVGSKGYSLRLDGMEKSFNGNIRRRAVVMHGAPYATEDWIRRYGRLGRSQGCPALPPAMSREVIDALKEKTAIFAYYPDDNYLGHSRYIQIDSLLTGGAADVIASLGEGL